MTAARAEAQTRCARSDGANIVSGFSQGVSGTAVHVGARTAALAQPGQVLVSSPGTWRIFEAAAS